MISWIMKYEYSAQKVSDLPKTKIPEFAMVGRSNVGKSSVINALAGQNKLARTSRTPGQTQKINIFSVNGEQLFMADLPGYGFAQISKSQKEDWAQNMSEYFEQRENLVGVLFLMDARRDVTREDIMLSKWFADLGLVVIGVQTKCDKLNKSQINAILKKQARDLLLAPEQMVSTSGLKKTGFEDLKKMILGVLLND